MCLSLSQSRACGVKHQPVLAMALGRGSVEIGLRRSEMKRHTCDAGEMRLIPRHLEKWFRNEDLYGLCIGISDAALAAASDGTSAEVELRRADKLVDPRLGALVEVVNAERTSGFPSGRAVSGFYRAGACSGASQRLRTAVSLCADAPRRPGVLQACGGLRNFD
jgi:hypothetical protein